MTSGELEAGLERLHEQSFGWALSCCAGDRAGAEDVLQSTYVRVISGRAVFAGRSAFRTWLFGVIRRVAWEHHRRARREGLRLVRLDHPAAEHAADERDPTADIDASRTLRAAFAELPERQREVLHLVFYQDLSIAEAADVMDVGLGTARTHYERGKARLRQLLESTGDDGA
jgi:RNA polymerase sigma-70 factor (ECF subfamily)